MKRFISGLAALFCLVSTIWAAPVEIELVQYKPEALSEFIKLCQDIKVAGIRPMYFGLKNTWTTLAPGMPLQLILLRLMYASQLISTK